MKKWEHDFCSREGHLLARWRWTRSIGGTITGHEEKREGKGILSCKGEQIMIEWGTSRNACFKGLNVSIR